MKRRAEALLERLSREGTRVGVPAPVVVEYLAGVGQASQAKQFELLNEKFEIHPVDDRAVRLAGEIERRRQASRKKQHQGGVPQRCAKMDVLILSVAIVSGAKEVFTDNVKEFRKLAENRITVSDLPDAPPVQINIPWTGAFYEVGVRRSE